MQYEKMRRLSLNALKHKLFTIASLKAKGALAVKS
jgi:hypothetical protein